MPGPKTPFGYAPFFHDTLATILSERPLEVVIETGKNPKHLRSQFNQFRNSWLHQAQEHRKRKEIQQEQIARQNYYALMEYECQLEFQGIKLVHRSEQKAIITTKKSRISQAADTITQPALFDTDTQLRSILNSGPVIPNNPPQIQPSDDPAKDSK